MSKYVGYRFMIFLTFLQCFSVYVLSTRIVWQKTHHPFHEMYRLCAIFWHYILFFFLSLSDKNALNIQGAKLPR